MRKVVFCETAFRLLVNCVVNAANKYEVGGLLLGTGKGRMYRIMAVTVPEKGAADLTSFTLDSVTHIRQAQARMVELPTNTRILGVWHSHICDGLRFSAQDRKSNQQLATILGETLSVLCVLSDISAEPKIATYHVSAAGEERRCRIITEKGE